MHVESSSSALPVASLAPSRTMRAKFLREVAAAGLSSAPPAPRPILEADLAGLPETARRYLHFMRTVGRPRVWSLRARFTGGFRMRPDARWASCEAWQYDSRVDIARIFHMRMRLSGLLPVYVRDTYVRGEARMLGRLLDTFPIVDGHDEKIAIGELVTYLNDALLFAPSMVLGPEATWTEVDERSFDVALVHAGRRVTARAFVDDAGALTDFHTRDRFGNDPANPDAPMVRALWTTPVTGWVTSGDRPVPVGARAVWHYPSGEFEYADFRVDPRELALDVPVG